jgi:hypothetical protein
MSTFDNYLKALNTGEINADTFAVATVDLPRESKVRIDLPKVAHHKCSACGIIAEYYFNGYGSCEPCISCNAAPSDLIKVIVKEVI